MRLSKSALASILPALLPLLAQTAAPTASQLGTPTVQVYARETIVDVTVTDAKGNPVHDLKQEDFTVKEDGKPQPIRSFTEFRNEDSPDSDLPQLPPNTYTNRQPPPAGNALNVFLLDFLNSAPDIPPDVYNGPLPTGAMATLSVALQRQHLMKADAIKYLQTMPSGTRLLLLGMFQPGSLHILQGITSDPAILSAAIDATQYGTQSSASNKELWCTQQETRNRSTLESFSQIASDLAAIKGRKNLIWFNVGLATITDPARRPTCLTDYSKDLQKAYALFAAAQITVFPVSVRGVEQPSDAEAAAVLSMEALAEDTGGAAFYQSNDVAGLVSKAVDKGSSYYTISYVPPGQKFDYSHHTINVSIDKPDLKLVYRKSYDAVDPASIKPPPGLTITIPSSAQADDLKAMMGRNLPTSSQLIFNVYVEPAPAQSSAAPSAIPAVMGTLDPKFKGKPLTRYNFLYSFPASRLIYTTNPDGSHHGSLELDLAAYDPDGKLVTGLSQTIGMPFTDARFQQYIGGQFRFLQQLDLPAGQLFLRVGIFDQNAKKIGTLELPLTVPKK